MAPIISLIEAGKILRNIKQFDVDVVEVVGHADEQPIGSANPILIGTFCLSLRIQPMLPPWCQPTAGAPEPYIRIVLAENSQTESVLAVLARDRNSFVGRWVAANANADDATLEALAKDEVEAVRGFLCQNPKLV